MSLTKWTGATPEVVEAEIAAKQREWAEHNRVESAHRAVVIRELRALLKVLNREKADGLDELEKARKETVHD